MTDFKFNPYKISKVLIDNMGDNELIQILGTSSVKNKKGEVSEYLKELVDLLKNKDIKVGTLEPYDHYDEPKMGLLQHIFEHNKYFVFIGCPHDCFSEIRFHGDSIIIDPWGIVNKELEGQGKIIS